MMCPAHEWVQKPVRVNREEPLGDTLCVVMGMLCQQVTDCNLLQMQLHAMCSHRDCRIIRL